jgi:hypothetical protein
LISKILALRSCIGGCLSRCSRRRILVLLLLPSLNAFMLWCIGLSTPPVADIVDYFKEICTLSRSIECTSLVTRIALNIRCKEMHNTPIGVYLSLVFLILCTPMFCVKSQIILFLCCMREATRCFSYPTKHTCYVPMIN